MDRPNCKMRPRFVRHWRPNCKMRPRFVWHWRLAQLLLILLLCGISTKNGMPSDLDGLQCSNCTQLRHLPCAVRRSVPCTDVVDSEREDVTLGVPNDVAVKRYYRIYPTAKGDITLTGINVTFRLPYGFDTPGLLQGFEIEVIGASGPIVNQQICHRMDFSQANFTGSRLEQDMILFFDCLPPELDIDAVVVTTLPKYEEISYVHILSKNFEPAPDDPNWPMTADRWQPMVKLTQVSSLCELTVTYDQGPTRFHYDSYQVTIYGSRTRQIDLQNLEKQNDSLKGEYRVNISNFVGKHSLFTAKVQPRGYIFGMESLASNEVNLTGCSSVLPSEPNPDQALPELKPGQGHPGMLLPQAQLWFLAVALIIIVAIACFIAYKCRHKCRKGKYMAVTEPSSNLQMETYTGGVPPNSTPGPGRESNQHALVLLWYDNRGHLDAVRLCQYLEQDYACTTPINFDTKEATKAFQARQLGSADCLLIINSAGANRSKTQMLIKSNDLKELEDLLAETENGNTVTHGANCRFYVFHFPCKYRDHHEFCCDMLIQCIYSFIEGMYVKEEDMITGHHIPFHSESATDNKNDGAVPSTLYGTTCLSVEDGTN